MQEFKDGWLLTIDIGKIINGWFYAIDRKKDLSSTSKLKMMMPREIEELYQHLAVEGKSCYGNLRES